MSQEDLDPGSGPHGVRNASKANRNRRESFSVVYARERHCDALTWDVDQG